MSVNKEPQPGWAPKARSVHSPPSQQTSPVLFTGATFGHQPSRTFLPKTHTSANASRKHSGTNEMRRLVEKSSDLERDSGNSRQKWVHLRDGVRHLDRSS